MRRILDLAKRATTKIEASASALKPKETTYPSFDAALQACGQGYYDPDLARVVLVKTQVAMRSPWPDLQWLQGAGLFMALPYAAFKIGKTIRVLDVGGSYGVHGMICAEKFKNIDIRWAVVESKAFADIAAPIENDKLRVFSDIGCAVEWLGGVDLMHSSGTLQYLKDPIASARELDSLGAPMMLWQRMAFATNDPAIVVQTSQLSDNGMGPLPEGFTNRPVSYPATYIRENDLLAALPDYSVSVRIPSDVSLSGGLATFGTVLLMERA